jgi:hypothetical protein
MKLLATKGCFKRTFRLLDRATLEIGATWMKSLKEKRGCARIICMT